MQTPITSPACTGISFTEKVLQANVPVPKLELATVLPVVNASDTFIYSELLLLNTAKVKSYDAAN